MSAAKQRAGSEKSKIEGKIEAKKGTEERSVLDKIVGGAVLVGAVLLVVWAAGRVLGYFLTSVLAVVVAYAIMHFWFGIDILVHITGDTSSPEIDIVFEKEGAKKGGAAPAAPVYEKKKQVFNIPQNIFGYDDAKTVCAAYDARLATVSEVEGAYNNGASWCNYGWSADQMALFPTQKSVYDKLQKKEGHEHDCGRPGVNGGYMANPGLKFGANCFGVKPAMTAQDKLWMETQPAVPKTQAEVEADKKASYWSKHLDQLLMSPFNKTNWSRY
jgi:hypothetical protein